MNLGDIYLAFICGTLILIMFASSLIMFLIHYKKKQNLHIREKVEMEHQYQSQLLQSQLEVQEQAFQNFSEEIHDNIGQVLSLTKYHLYKIGQNNADIAVTKDIEQSKELLSKAISDLRNISHTLNGTYISKVGLINILDKELEYVQSAKGIDCNLEITGNTYSMGTEKELLIFRIVQESIGNAIKHGKPDKIDVTMDFQPGSLDIAIADNGTGFEVEEAMASNRGMGLNNIHVRTNLLNGRLDIKSVKEQGTVINLHINTKT